jgi:hypothetical protein
MDELKDKFKGLFNKATNAATRASQGTFKGQGHRLGSAEVRWGLLLGACFLCLEQMLGTP